MPDCVIDFNTILKGTMKYLIDYCHRFWNFNYSYPELRVFTADQKKRIILEEVSNNINQQYSYGFRIMSFGGVKCNELGRETLLEAANTFSHWCYYLLSQKCNIFAGH